MTNTDWLPAIMMLSIGAIVGVILMIRTAGQRRTTATVPTDTAGDLEIRDLTAERDDLIQQLRELNDTAAKRTTGQLAEERLALELAAARVMRDLDRRELAIAAAPASAASNEEATSSYAIRALTWGGVSFAVIALLGWFVWKQSAERQPGGSVTGGSGMEAGAAQMPDETIIQLQQAIEKDPESLDLRLELAYAYLIRQDLMSVFNLTQYVLEREPSNARALSYQALVRLAMGEADRAETMLKQALEKDPNLRDAWAHLALVYIETNRLDEAEKAVAEAAKRQPEQAAMLSQLIADARRGGPGAPAPTGGGAVTAPQGAQAVSGGREISGVVDVDPAIRVDSSAVIFVIVRPEGVTQGSALAVQRLPAAGFPVAFRLGAPDMMAPGELPERVRVEARIDMDGNPMSRDDAAGGTFIDGVSLGSSNLRLVIGSK